MVNKILTVLLLGLLIFISLWIRKGTLTTPTVLDYDPWWFYRYAESLLNNNLKPPGWDELSFAMPGRPVDSFLGWPYTMVGIHYLLSFLGLTADFMRSAILSPLFLVALIPAVAYTLGRTLSNWIGGLVTAFFIALSPAFVGVSMAGYCDSDAPVVFYTFLSTWLVLFALQRSHFKFTPFPTKRTIFYLSIASIGILVFVWNWGGGWLTLILFTAFLPFLLIFRVLESAIQRSRVGWNSIKTELKQIALPLLGLIITCNLLGQILGLSNQFSSWLGGLAFTGVWGQPLLVNISVAELQPLNLFKRADFLALAERVGLLPLILTLFGLPFLILYKLLRRESISWVEIFLLVWAFCMLLLVTRGIRFALLFGCAAATAAGYVIGQLSTRVVPKDWMSSACWGSICLLGLFFLSNALQLAYAQGMLISENWYNALDWLKQNASKDALIATWWDPGHIITGYTGLRVHADGAHCGPGDCIPYDHNVRIQDMGKIFTTSNEEEAFKILEKYRQLTPEQIKLVKQSHPKLPDSALRPADEVYLIASDDLILKYHWMSYFGTGQGRSFVQFFFERQEPDALVYVNPMLGASLRLKWQEGTFIPLLNVPRQGIKDGVIKEVVHFFAGVQQRYEIANVSKQIDGLVWVVGAEAFFMEPAVRDSLFVKLFFFGGEGLKHFKLVYSNPQVKIFKLIFSNATA